MFIKNPENYDDTLYINLNLGYIIHAIWLKLKKRQIYGIVKHIKTLKQNEFELKKLKVKIMVKS